MTRKEQILKAAEFDEMKVYKEARDLGHLGDESRVIIPSYEDGYMVGALTESRRLMPLITALAERVEMLEGALEKYRGTSICLHDGDNFVADDVLGAPSALDEILKQNETNKGE